MNRSVVRTVVVDDQEEVRDLLRLRLERTGRFAVVAEGTDGHQAIALCVEHQPDVVIVDAAMPVLNGIDAVPDIAEGAPSTAIIIYTAETGMATRNEAERVGAHAVVGKLDPFERLVDTIYRLVPGQEPETPAPNPDTERMASLLTEKLALKPQPPPPARPAKTNKRFIVLALLVLLPGLAFVAWVLAAFSGFLVR